MSTKKKQEKVSKPSTTEQFYHFVSSVNNAFRTVDNRFNTIIGLLSAGEIDEEDFQDTDVYFSSTHLIREGKVYKIKYITEGFSLEPKEEGKETNWKFKKGEDLVIEIEAPTLEEAYTELVNRIKASKNIEIVKA